MVHDPTPKHKIGMHSYLNEIHCGLGPPIFTIQPLHSGCVILILIWTHIQCPRQSPLADSSTHSTLPKVLPMASAFSLVIHLIYSPKGCCIKHSILHCCNFTWMKQANHEFIKRPWSLYQYTLWVIFVIE